jgi:hypothetical protein
VKKLPRRIAPRTSKRARGADKKNKKTLEIFTRRGYNKKVRAVLRAIHGAKGGMGARSASPDNPGTGQFPGDGVCRRT